MKTTLEIPADLFRRAKASAALRGESLKEFVTEALAAHLDRQGNKASAPRGWRSVFGLAQKEDVEVIDAIVAQEFEHIDQDEWR
ncbi:MAG TPA: hypothetical protein VGB99_09760 [Acidobacteriota bacterium]